jgi:hypothetical protein
MTNQAPNLIIGNQINISGYHALVSDQLFNILWLYSEFSRNRGNSEEFSNKNDAKIGNKWRYDTPWLQNLCEKVLIF